MHRVRIAIEMVAAAHMALSLYQQAHKIRERHGITVLMYIKWLKNRG